MQALEGVPAIAILTSNDEDAVEAFLDRWPDLRARVRTVVGRRALGGPKTSFEVFSLGYATCLRAVVPPDGAMSVTYVGDMDYELAYARQLGATAVDVRRLDAPARPGGEG